jgi:hypothetical protein
VAQQRYQRLIAWEVRPESFARGLEEHKQLWGLRGRGWRRQSWRQVRALGGDGPWVWLSEN